MTSTFVGLAAGVSAALVGGLISWYLFFTPMSWSLSPEGWIPLLGFFVIASVIVTTTHLYRLSERRNYQAQLAAIQKQAEAADLFAREMAHRLKNALAIVQSIAFQTLGDDMAATGKFAARLKTLADAHDLLSEHIERPTASAADVVRAALQPFVDEDERVDLELADVRIAAQQVVSLALAVHELGTNASKYGALSARGGRVLLTIEDARDRVRLIWSESGGPPVQQPESTGFGTKVLKRLGTDAEFRFEPDGLCYSMYLRKN
jgi:two-component sensor histidine kinase